MSVILYPRCEVIGTVFLGIRPLPVCQSVQCADKGPPFGFGALVTGGIGWEFEWGMTHGQGFCIRCKAWHQLYHYRDEEWVDAPATGREYPGRKDTVTGERGPSRWLYVFAEIIDSRPEHYADGKVPELEGASSD